MNNKDNVLEVNRRSFLGTSVGSMMLMMGGMQIVRSQDKPADAPPERYSGPPVNCAVIGCGQWGREIIATLSRIPKAPIVGICDTYPAYLRRAKNSAPNAEQYSDYRKVLENKEIQAVFVATPTHLHKEIVIAALEAGKHVYCEAPLAHTVEDARTIAQAALKSPKSYFQSGLQHRADPEIIYVLNFVRAGAAGKAIQARGQYHKKNSWRRSSPNADQERALNWRLQKSISTGLAGEIGIHQIDQASWFINERPTAVTGFGSTLHWNDGRETPDTIQSIVEYRSGARTVYDATLCNSFDASYDILYGTDATVMMRDRRGWMFKEVDSPLLGWEVYARKETFFNEVGIVLAANATKLAAQGKDPVIDTQINTQNSLFYALTSFIWNADLIKTGVADFISNFGDSDLSALGDYLKDLQKNKLPAAEIQEGYDATVVAVKANESIMKGGKIELGDDLFALS